MNEVTLHFDTPWWYPCLATTCSHHHHGRVAGEDRRVIAPPCPRSTARLQSSPIGRVESFYSWSIYLFRGRPGGRHHVRSGGRLSDTLMWSRRAMFTGVSSSNQATCPNTEMRRRDRRWDGLYNVYADCGRHCMSVSAALSSEDAWKINPFSSLHLRWKPLSLVSSWALYVLH